MPKQIFMSILRGRSLVSTMRNFLYILAISSNEDKAQAQLKMSNVKFLGSLLVN